MHMSQVGSKHIFAKLPLHQRHEAAWPLLQWMSLDQEPDQVWSDAARLVKPSENQVIPGYQQVLPKMWWTKLLSRKAI